MSAIGVTPRPRLSLLMVGGERLFKRQLAQFWTPHSGRAYMTSATSRSSGLFRRDVVWRKKSHCALRLARSGIVRRWSAEFCSGKPSQYEVHAADFPNTDAQEVDVADRPNERRKQFLDGNPKSGESSFELPLSCSLLQSGIAGYALDPLIIHVWNYFWM